MAVQGSAAARAGSIVAAALVIGGCAGLRPPGEVVALPLADGGVELNWSATSEPDARTRIERQVPGEEWEARGETVAGETRFRDESPGRGLLRYRLRTRTGDKLSRSSRPVEAVPVFRGLPLHGWLDASQERDCRIDEVESPSALQCAMEELGGKAGSGRDPERGPHVLFFPAGEYEIDRTLWLEGRAGVQLVGETPGETVLRWVGPPGRGPEQAAVLFHAEGNRDSAWRNLVWDGGCAEPQRCHVVAFDQSFCGRTDLSILRSDSCDARRLGWPEDPTVGESDNGGAHVDSTFRNAWIGLRAGRHGVADDSTSLRRVRFENNFAGASYEDFNALHHWYWEPTFVDNRIGVTNHLLDTEAFPGRWGGDFAIFRGRFLRSADADIVAEPTGEFVVRDSASSGSRRFFVAAGPNRTPGSFSLIGNHVHTSQSPLVDSATPGPLLLLDNRFSSRAPGPLVSARAIPLPAGEGPDLDLISIGNRYSVDGEPFSLTGTSRWLSIDDRIEPDGAGDDVLDAIPEPVPSRPLHHRPVYTVTGAHTDDPARNAARIQSFLDRAAADPAPAIVHLPGLEGTYRLSRTLTVPDDADLVITGDGPWTTLQWTGPRGAPLLEVSAADLRHLVVRDLQFRDAGIVVGDIDDGGDILLHGVRIGEAAEAAVRIRQVGASQVDLVDVQLNSGLTSGVGVGLRVDGGDAAAPSRVRFWSGLLLRNATDLEVSGNVELLLSDIYMEQSRTHARISRGSGGAIEHHAGKIASFVSLPSNPTPGQVDRATAAISIEPSELSLSLLATRMFLVDPGAGEHPSPAADHGARIVSEGPSGAIRAVGLTLRRGAAAGGEFREYRLGPESGRYLRVSSSVATPEGRALEDRVIDKGISRALGVGEVDPAEVKQAMRMLRTLSPPRLYDGDGAADHRVVFDRVFVFRAPAVGVELVGPPAQESQAATRKPR